VLDTELDYKRLAFICERFVEFGRNGIKSSILGRLQTFIFLSIAIKLSGTPSKNTSFTSFVG